MVVRDLQSGLSKALMLSVDQLKMNLRQIETFLCVAELASFRRAAETLHRSQSVVSVHVQQMEKELGLPQKRAGQIKVLHAPSKAKE